MVEARMTTIQIIPALDKGKNLHTSLSMAVKALPVEQPTFECGEKTLAHGVIVAIPDLNIPP